MYFNDEEDKLKYIVLGLLHVLAQLQLISRLTRIRLPVSRRIAQQLLSNFPR
jgi:hypothetical protein